VATGLESGKPSPLTGRESTPFASRSAQNKIEYRVIVLVLDCYAKEVRLSFYWPPFGPEAANATLPALTFFEKFVRKGSLQGIRKQAVAKRIKMNPVTEGYGVRFIFGDGTSQVK
jgi:hypothetical protein